MTKTGIRKVTIPSAYVEKVKDLAWRNRVSVSQIVREILQEYRDNPGGFKELPDMEGPPVDTITVYVPSVPWLAARDAAYTYGRTPISVIIRKGLRLRLESEYIPEGA